jgi:hypothetical protein
MDVGVVTMNIEELCKVSPSFKCLYPKDQETLGLLLQEMNLDDSKLVEYVASKAIKEWYSK